MKNLVMNAIAFVGVLLVIESINSAVLLSMHDSTFYFTWEGIKQVMVLVVVEGAVLLYPAYKWVTKIENMRDELLKKRS